MPQCDNADHYLDQYELALISLRESGATGFQAHLACHVPGGITESMLDSHMQKRLERLRALGARTIIHPLSFADRLRNFMDSQRKSDCLAGTYMRLDVPQIVDAIHAQDGNANQSDHHVLYTDLDILWWRKVSPDELLASVQQPDYAVAYSSQMRKSEGPRNAGVVLIDVPNFRKVQHALLSWAFEPEPATGVSPLRASMDSSADQGILNHFFDKHHGRAFLSDQWNYKMFWGAGSEDAAIVHYWGIKPGPGLQCFLKERSQEHCGHIDGGLIPGRLADGFQGEALSMALVVDPQLAFMQAVQERYDAYDQLREAFDP